jgi:malonyl-CoA decarboxylase
MQNPQQSEALQPHLMKLAAYYLFQERIVSKSKEAFHRRAVDPVANFHLKNGAMIHALNWKADESELRKKQSLGIMVNYRYQGIAISDCKDLYMKNSEIKIEPGFAQWVQ